MEGYPYSSSEVPVFSRAPVTLVGLYVGVDVIRSVLVFLGFIKL
jgi:hypothetical protein